MTTAALRARVSRLWAALEGRDLALFSGLALLAYGGERLLPGAGFAAAGAVLVAVAVLVR